MAITFEGISTQTTEDDNTGTTVSVDFTTNVEGDFLLACVGVSNAGTGTAVAMLDETDWTRMAANTWVSATAGATTFYYRFAPAGGITNQVFDAAATTGYVAVGMVLKGVDPTTPIDVGPLYNNHTTGTDTTETAPAYTTATDGAMGFISMNRDGAPVTITFPSGYTDRIQSGQAGPGDGVINCIGTEIHATAGAQTPGAFTWTTAQENCSMSFALRPETGGAYDQTSFRGVNDDGSESASTFIAAVNTDFNQVQDENFRIRFLIQEDDDVEDLDVTFQLQYNLNAAGWNDVNASSNVVRSSLSSNFADGDTTTQRIGAGTFVGTNNGMDESQGLAGGAGMDFTTTINQETEVEYCCQIRSVDTQTGDTIDLRVVNGSGSELTVYTSTPTITIPTGAGMMLASAQFLQGAAAAENPGTFNFSKSLPWGAITIPIRVSTAAGGKALSPTSKFNTLTTRKTVVVADAAEIDGTTINANVVLEDVLDITSATINGDLTIQTRGTYNFSNVTVTGDTINTDSGVGSNVTINASNGSSLTTTEPGTGDGLVDIVNTVIITITVLDATDDSPIEGAHVILLLTSDYTTEVLNSATNASGVATSNFNYATDVGVEGWAREADTVGTDFTPENISTTITANGVALTVRLDPIE